MAEPLYELLAPYLDTSSPPSGVDPITTGYLTRLSSLSLASLTTTEPQALAQASQSTLLSLQSLSVRSHGAIVASADHLSSLSTILPGLDRAARDLKDAIPLLDEQVLAFSTKYSKSAENEVLDRRKQALIMARNVDRLSDILDLPTLLTSTISSSSAQEASSTVNYASALDLHSHIKRLLLLYPDSPLIDSIGKQSEAAMQQLSTGLIMSLRSPNIKLAIAMRTIGWLRRVTPDLDGLGPAGSTNLSSKESALGALFLVCRLSTLVSTLSALDPLRDLADQESTLRQQHPAKPTTTTSTTSTKPPSGAWYGGQQTERYLKRYIEIFREQSFAIISMYKSIFPSSDPSAPTTTTTTTDLNTHPFKSPAPSPALFKSASPVPQQQHPSSPSSPSPLSTFVPHLISLLTETLRTYLPNVQDRSSRESLLTQVLYSAGSLGRLGADFSLMLALLEEDSDGGGAPNEDTDSNSNNKKLIGKDGDDTPYEDKVPDPKDDEVSGTTPQPQPQDQGTPHAGAGRRSEVKSPEWVDVMRKHRVLAGKLEMLARGGGGGG